MEFFYLILYVCLRLRFLDVETNPGTRRPVPAACRIILSNVQGLAGNLSDLIVASAQYVILLCSETLVSDMRQVSKLMHRSPCLAVPGQDTSGLAAYVRDGYGAFCQPKFECGCCEMLFFGFVV